MINRWQGRLRVLVLVVFVLGLVGSVGAQEDSPNFWGTGTNFLFVNAEEFQEDSYASLDWRVHGFGFWYFVGSGFAEAYAPVRLPTGSLVTGMTIIYRDYSGTWDVEVRLQKNWVTAAGDVGDTLVGSPATSSGAPGIMATWVDIDPDYTIQYVDGSTAQSYTLRLSMVATGDMALRGVIIGWNRQVSAAPLAATFADVPTDYWAFQHIEALAASGITVGCGGGNFCPDGQLTRDQMAVFLAKALGLHWAP